MDTIRENVSLKPFNTFGIDVKAQFFTEVHSLEDIQEIIRDEKLRSMPWLILGGGSNLLFTSDLKGLVIKNTLKGIDTVYENEDYVWIKAESGEIWHELVLYCTNEGLGGIENLSLIPGTVGAAPIQNIGAYGVELKDVFHSLEAVNLETGELEIFMLDECDFGYRNSVFKNQAKGKYFITSITLKLTKKPQLNVSYGAIGATLKDWNIRQPDIKDVSLAVCHIRSSKLPDPKVLGNAGSFFKNPEIEADRYKELQGLHPEIPGYVISESHVKVPAGWLIEQCGWKGKQVGHTGSHKDQALVLVNYGGASGTEIKDLAMEIQRSVKEKFGIELQPEVNIL